MKIGSRPIWRIARTGELTPPGRTCWARRKRSVIVIPLCSAVPFDRYAPIRNSRSSRVGSFPSGVVLGEVVEANLLVLGRGVEGGALVRSHPALGGDRVEDRVALLFRAAVGHREDAVGPVLVGRPLVAVGDAAEGGHATADLEDLLLRHLPDAHAVGGEAGPAVVEDRGDAAEDLAVDHLAQPLEQLLGRDSELGGG